MNDTFILTSEYNTSRWYIIDANNQPVGRIAPIIAYILQGKHKVDYNPSIDTEDYIIVINAKTMILDSWAYGHVKCRVNDPGRPGKALKRFFEKIPRRIIESCVKNMLPTGLRQKFYKRLHVYNTSVHPHEAQNPIPFNLD